MKKILLGTVAVCGLAVAAAAPAKAEGLELGISGMFIGYGVYNNQDEMTGVETRGFDLRKETEVHFTGETTLDNGLTVGVVVETNLDRADNADIVEESYAYISGGWGRFNLGEEEAATYLLQVAAPSADANIDGIQPEINSFNYLTLVSTAAAPAVGVGHVAGTQLGYDQTVTGYANKITYFTPVFSGFQAGISYTPALSEAPQNGLAPITANKNAGFDDAVEVAVRYEGTFDEIDLALGGGFSQVDREISGVGLDKRDVWNIAADLNWGPFGLGLVYKEDNNGISSNGNTDIFVVGLDYVTGPYTFGASYYEREDEVGVGAGSVGTATHGVAGDLETTRWTGGVGYEYGPGMSFRGSLAYVEAETSVAGDVERNGYQFSVGTQIDF